MPKAIVTGASGLLGREILKAFNKASWDVVGTGLTRSGPGITKLDLCDHPAVESLVESEQPSIIIHSAAERSPDKVASDPQKAKQLNVEATAFLSQLASSHNIPVLYISTDFVFPGVAGEAPYTENAPTRAPNEYGQLKLDGEHAVLSSPPSKASGIALGGVLRVPILYGPANEKGSWAESGVGLLVDKVRDSAAGKEVTMDDWSRRFPTSTTDVARAVVKVAARWLAMLALAADGDGFAAESDEPDGKNKNKKGWPTVLQFSANERLTKYEMCVIFADILGLDINSMKPDKEGGGGGGGVQRPYDTQLATGELETLLGGELETVDFREFWTKQLKSR